MSLFVAVRPDAAAAEDLQEAIARARRAAPGPELRWQSPGHWHLTLAFLGNPDDSVADEVAARLADLEATPSIPDLRLAGSGTFGGQVLWVALEPGPAHDALADIARRIPPLMRGSGAVADWRPWRAHLTIARARRGSPERVVDALDGYIGPRWGVSSVLLIRSTGGPRPQHHVIETIPLTGVSPGPPRSPA
ncbi:MAG: RNA 2',3'-cyclic phosphodiesterase [Actinomycetales bacterium]|nr:RNA 2',3'-cyclic phosphodiesterase [Actinomycetales bacterium]